MKDKVLKEKMDTLSPLYGGIVFGKEEAWDKLQARMDTPAKKIPIRLYWSAAAILLLLISIYSVYHQRVKDITLQAKRDLPASPAQATQEQPSRIAIVPGALQPVKNKATEHKITPVPTEPVNVLATIQIPVAVNPITENTVATTVELATPQKKQMKVMHINEMNETGSAIQPSVVITDHNVLSAGKQKVVHLNEINDRQERIDEYLIHRKDNFAVSLQFFNNKTFIDNTTPNNEDNAIRYPLKFKLN